MTDSAGRLAGLADLHARLHGCCLCLNAGYDIFPRAIFSGGMGAHLMIIGQAPGITEKEAGPPFKAGSGTRLFKWRAAAGIEAGWFRRTQYRTSVTKCYPGGAKSGSGDGGPTRLEQRLCRPYLDAEISLVNPDLILPVGRLAINLFYPAHLALEQVIGTQKQVAGRWVIPLPHPSGASRWHQSEHNRRLVQQALELLKEHLIEGKEVYFNGD